MLRVLGVEGTMGLLLRWQIQSFAANSNVVYVFFEWLSYFVRVLQCWVINWIINIINIEKSVELKLIFNEMQCKRHAGGLEHIYEDY